MKKLEKFKRNEVKNLNKIYGGCRTASFCDSYTGSSEEYPCGDISSKATGDEGEDYGTLTYARDCLV